MYYSLIGDAPPLHEKILLTETDPIFQVELPINPPPGYKDTIEEVKFLLQIMQRDFKAKREFIIAADADFLGFFLALLMELGIQEDREAELREIEKALVIPIMKIKYHYNRARPFQYAAEAGIPFPQFPTQTGHSPAYPSGHTIQSYYIAAYLGSLYPQHRKIFMDLARDISFSRLQCGVHFPSDCMFGVTIFRYLWRGGPATMKLSKNREQEIWNRFRYIQ